MAIRRLRVLVVDDSALVRKIVSDLLTEDPELEVVATAANGRIALEKLERTPVDLITLDLEMPVMDGFTMLVELRKTRPHLPVILFSTVSVSGAKKTLDALAAGADDYVTKPSKGTMQEVLQSVRTELVGKVRLHGFAALDALPEARTVAPSLPSPQLPPLTPIPPSPIVAPRLQMPPHVIAIGVSTGGPNALAEVFARLPKGLPLPIVIVQHMPPLFTRLLAERLSARSQILVKEAATGDLLEPGHAYIAPGDWHLVLERGAAGVQIVLNQAHPENSCRPSVDPLFRSAAKVYGPRTLAVVLTGMGQDGLLGCEQVRAAGGSVLVQDQKSSVVWGMPGAVARAGLADLVLPLGDVADELVRRAWAGRVLVGTRS